MSGDLRDARSDLAADAIDGSFVPVARPGVGVVAVDRDIVLGLISEDRRLQTAALNESASIVWQCFDGSGTIDEIATDIATVFGAEAAAVRDDVVALVRAVGGAGFLVGVHEPVIDIRDDEIAIEAGLLFPEFAAVDDQGRPFSRATLRGRPTLLVSWSATCEFCARIAADLDELLPSLAAANIELVRLVTGDDVDGFAGMGTPVAYLVDEHGRVAEPAALGAAAVLTLARRLASQAV